jgi:hypothetical protein
MVTLDEKMVAGLREDYTQAPISQQDRVMLDYVVQLTKDATRITPQVIASWFNYINRAADALGVGRGKREDWYPPE